LRITWTDSFSEHFQELNFRERLIKVHQRNVGDSDGEQSESVGNLGLVVARGSGSPRRRYVIPARRSIGRDICSRVRGSSPRGFCRLYPLRAFDQSTVYSLRRGACNGFKDWIDIAARPVTLARQLLGLERLEANRLRSIPVALLIAIIRNAGVRAPAPIRTNSF
jgi:hypothetical protein